MAFAAYNRGRVRVITGTDPAAGAELSETVPAGARWRLLAFRALLVTDATVANRSVTFTVDDGTTTVLQVSDNAVQAASLTHTYQGMVSGQIGAMGGSLRTMNFPPDLILTGGYRIRSSTGSIQAGDNWGAPIYMIEEL